METENQQMAQVTIKLEYCAQGIVPLVTPGSGFFCPYANFLAQDPAKTRDITQWVIAMPEDENGECSWGHRVHGSEGPYR